MILCKSELPDIIHIILSKVINDKWKDKRTYDRKITKGQRGSADTHRLANPVDS